jgi:hypothetical protein
MSGSPPATRTPAPTQMKTGTAQVKRGVKTFAVGTILVLVGLAGAYLISKNNKTQSAVASPAVPTPAGSVPPPKGRGEEAPKGAASAGNGRDEPAAGDASSAENKVGMESGRRLEVSVHTVGESVLAQEANRFNATIQNASATLDGDGALCVTFDFEGERNVNREEAGAFLVRLFDKHGMNLAHFHTAEHYGNSSSQLARQMARDRARTNDFYHFRALEPTGNRLCYQVNMRDAPSVAAMEFGFYLEADE